jgi:hypothetical protein
MLDQRVPGLKEGLSKRGNEKSAWKSYACKVDGAMSIVNVHQEENNP